MAWETVPLENGTSRRPHGENLEELYTTLKKVQRKFSREEEVDPFV